VKQFVRSGDEIRIQLSEFEVRMLTSLVEQLAGLLEGEPTDPGRVDPITRWQAELADFDDPDLLDHSDPVIQRLFPDAYPDDPGASADFRRFTQGQQRWDRLEHAGIVRAALSASDAGSLRVIVPVGEAEAWLKLLTGLRLSLAARLRIESASDAEVLGDLPEDDPRSSVYRVYEWLAYLSENLLDLL